MEKEKGGGGVAARQSVNKGAIKAAPECLGEKKKSESELAITPNLKPEGDAEEGARFPWGVGAQIAF